MGAEQSTPQEPSTDYPLEQIYGFHVLKVKYILIANHQYI
jgi:hypothetical protein